jgi:two-component system, cell cycle sensor histidine kinase and response regulator CckA
MKPDVVFGLENVAWPALLADAGGAIHATNAAAKNIFGPALTGPSPHLQAIWAVENGALSEILGQLEQSALPVTALKFRAANGTTIVFLMAVAPFLNAGKIFYAFQFLPANEPMAGSRTVAAGDPALKQKLDCVLQLARTVSLDFNNALTGVLAHTSLLLGKAEPEHPWRRSLLEVEKSAARAAEIASELAQFSRQEKVARRAAPANLNIVVGRCVEIMQNAHGARFKWRVNQERALYGARFDEAKVQQAITKILENAVEAFGLAGNGQISVQTRNLELTEATQDRNVRLNAGTYVCVEISDNGTGIDAESLPKIFEPFFTTKRPPHRGLGLALVYGIVTNHGGGVALSSQPGVGTSARVYLPAERTVIHETPTAGGLRGTGTVLVVDDEAIVLTMAETILSDFGYKVLTANNGQKALGLLSQPGTKVDLVITDLVMPGMGGRELMEKIRQLDPGLPLLPISGYVLTEEKTGPAGYLQKPFTSTELLRKVKQALAPTAVVD